MTTQTFIYTGDEQIFVVPSDVYSLHVVAFGADGGCSLYAFPIAYGLGGKLECDLNVAPGEVLHLFVGGKGNRVQDVPSWTGLGGWNGGGDGGYSLTFGSSVRDGNGGGGATDIRIGGNAITDRVIVVGGGGGGTTNCNSGGTGGGATGGTGNSLGSTASGWGGNGTGGMPSAGGSGGSPGNPPGSFPSGFAATGGSGDTQGVAPPASGLLGRGGDGGDSSVASRGQGAGGGGGGYHGGGGGGGAGATAVPGGGGGGNSYADVSRCSNVIDTQGGHSLQIGEQPGSIVLTWTSNPQWSAQYIGII